MLEFLPIAETAITTPPLPQTGPIVGDLSGELAIIAAWDLGSRLISAEYDADTWHDKYMKRRWLSGGGDG